MKTKTECHETEPNPSNDRAMPEGDNLSFEINFYFGQFNSFLILFRILKQVPKY